MENRSYLPSLQILRGLAALMVVFHHLWLEVGHSFSIHAVVLDKLAGLGRLGVDFFFVLSGFIICHAHFSKMGDPSAAPAYLKGRLLRIYLPYLPLSTGLLLLYALLPNLSFVGRSDFTWLKSLTLLPLRGSTALSVAWTLVFEMFFYTIFLLAFLSRRLFGIILAAWALLIVCVPLPVMVLDPALPDFLRSPYHLEFMCGIGAAVAFRRLSPARMRWWIVSMAALVAVGWMCPVFVYNKILQGLLFSAVILVVIHTPLNRVRAGNLFMVIGNASYSIYLLHNPVISLFARLTPRFGAGYFLGLWELFIFAVVCAGGIVYSFIFEQRLMALAKKGRMFQPLQLQLNNPS